jgi:hypothetical protein
MIHSEKNECENEEGERDIEKSLHEKSFSLGIELDMEVRLSLDIASAIVRCCLTCSIGTDFRHIIADRFVL